MKLTTKNLIAEAWDGYRKIVVPENPTAEQERQLKIAFYGGALTVLQVAKRVGEPDVSEELGVEAFAGMDAEVTAFRKGLS